MHRDLVKLERKIAAYRQLQHDTTSQRYNVASALLVPDERTLEATLRQLNQFGYDLDRLQFVAQDEVGKSVCGIISPSAFAAFRLMANSNFVGC